LRCAVPLFSVGQAFAFIENGIKKEADLAIRLFFLK
jgi:hypothetical protein